ncbi:MAG: FAD-binding protein [Candidatus Electrothrix sp. AUS3]|nr:FAD-binding protein [Candidatus Electrothrix gigas]
MSKIQIIGAGLAGCEAAWQAAERGCSVELYEMKPHRLSPAHESDLLAELVCSNSLRSNAPDSAVGLLKEELRRLFVFLTLLNIFLKKRVLKRPAEP